MTTELMESAGSFQPARQDIPASPAEVPEILGTLVARWRLLAAVALCAALAAIPVVWFLPDSFRAEATILPPQQQQPSLGALASMALGGLASGASASPLGLKNPSDLYIGILESRTIADDIIDHFQLEPVYQKRRRSETRKELARHSSFSSGKDSLIKITFEDRDPQRAAAVANAYIDELYKENSVLAITDASQRRLFFERELATEKQALAAAEIALKQTEHSTGLIAPAGQTEVLIRAGAQIRAEIASREVQLQAMRAFATDENPQLQVLKKEISELGSQLAKVEKQGGGGTSELSAGKLPEAGLEYLRSLRDVKYHETLFELLARQYEAARMDEAKQAPVIQVVDRAVVPDKKSWPPRAMLVVAAALLGLALASGLVLLWRPRIAPPGHLAAELAARPAG